MTSGRRLPLIALVIASAVIAALFALSAASAPGSPSAGDERLEAGNQVVLESVALDAESVSTTSPSLGDAVEDPAVTAPSDSAATADSAEGLRALPRADGLPDPAVEVVDPIGIRIADIGVDGSVVPVGVEADGSFEVPSVSQVGWYRFGSTAGAPGSTVLAGHISFNGVDGVFRHLESVGVGAAIAVEMADGTVAEYRVVDVVEYHKEALPVDDLFSESGDDRLVLITCGGTFNPRLRSYDSNVVAYGVPLAG